MPFLDISQTGHIHPKRVTLIKPLKEFLGFWKWLFYLEKGVVNSNNTSIGKHIILKNGSNSGKYGNDAMLWRYFPLFLPYYKKRT